MTDILSLSLPELAAALPELQAYKIAQIFSWLHRHRARDFAEMTNLSAALRAELAANFEFPKIKIEKVFKSELDKTLKFLYNCECGEKVESALLDYSGEKTLCVSTQAGCKMGCTFCANRPEGFKRSLTAGEMLSEVYLVSEFLNNAAPGGSQKIKSIVLMGVGEPLDNYDSVLRFIRLLTAEEGYNLSARAVTLSTCGLVPQIYALAEEKLPITLAISLHEVTDEARARIMPITRRYTISEVMKAARHYGEKTRRRVSLEYAVSPEQNDTPFHVEQLARLARGMHINLIPLNPTKDNAVKADKAAVFRFAEALGKRGANATVRRTLGSDISASCGQLVS